MVIFRDILGGWMLFNFNFGCLMWRMMDGG
jgi:hypothetical protein